MVYLSLPGYASSDSQLKDVRAFEGLMLAGAGVFSDMGLNRVLRGVNPSYSPLALARPSPIPSPCTQLTRAGIEWRRCHRAACMARPYQMHHRSVRAGP